MERRLLNPKIDFVFKKIFGSEKHPGVLISFLNAVLKPKNEITKVEIKNTEIDKSYIEDKFSRLDVKAITGNKEREMYYLREKSIKDEISALSNAEERGERKKTIEIVTNMLNEGLDEKMISKLTKIDINKVIDIKNKN